MAMYYQGSSEIQADGLQTLYLMNPNYTGYADTQQQQQQQHLQPANMFFLNSAIGGNLPHGQIPSQAHTQHFVGVPLQANLQDLSRPSVHEAISASHHGLFQRLWSPADQNSGGCGVGDGENGSHSHVQSSSVVSPGSGIGPTTDFTSQLGFQRPGTLVSPTQQHQGLSLSLSPQQQQQQKQQQMSFRSLPLDHHEISPHENHQVGILSSSSSPRTNTHSNDNIRASGTSSFSFPNGMILGSKYLKAAQELLDEVVNVGQSIKADGAKDKHKVDNESMPLASDVVVPTSGSGESSSQKNSVVELTTAQRQELQMKKAKLVSMLDEVEQRYRQYHHQMQIIVASFEQAAGIGSAKSYTQLALHTISKQFRCLKDAISGQIKATSKSLGEEESLGGKIEGSSRLKFVDHHLRQQRALQQLGMMQPNAWRPQRGLPERAVSVLRAWLFEHFLHPYPKDSDKIMLAKQTGLTRSQVSNWFINARVRLWKPMVEEMYLEEVKNNQEQNGLQENINKNEPNKEVASKSSVPHDTSKLRKDKQLPSSMQDASPTDISTSTISTSPNGGSLPGFSFIGSLNMENTAERNTKKPRNDMQNSSSSILSVDTQMKAAETNRGDIVNDEKQTRESYPLMSAYTMGEFGKFNPEQLATNFQGNGVSLTLGLPPSENLALSGSHQQNFLPNQNIGLGSRLEMGRIDSHYNRMSNPQASHPTISYENIDFQSGKRYPAQLLPDFVS